MITEQFNAYVDVNTVRQVDAPGDTALAEPFTVNLEERENVVRVRLAAKGTQTQAEVYDSDAFYYKVTGTDFRVSNLGKTGLDLILHPEMQLATQFTTGSNASGYTLSKVRIDISIEDAGVIPVVSIYSDVSGSPGASIKTLTNPASITVPVDLFVDRETTEADFDAGDYKLDADTPYWVMLENPHDTLQIYISMTEEDSEDGSAPGWSIGNLSQEIPFW